MNVTMKPFSANGTVFAPPSKSDAHRAIICAALSGGVCTIAPIALSDDIRATIGCVEALGATAKIENKTLTVDGTTYNVPQTGDAGEKGGGAIGGNSIIQWRLVNDIFALEITYAAGTDAFVNDAIAIRLTDADNHNYGGLDGKTLKANAAWIYKVNTDYYYFIGTVQLSIVSDGLGTLSFPDGYYVDPDLTPISDATLLQTIKHRPFVFMNIPTL